MRRFFWTLLVAIAATTMLGLTTNSRADDGDKSAGDSKAAGKDGGGDKAANPEAQKQLQKMRELYGKLRDLQDAGKDEEAKKVREELQAMRKDLAEKFPNLGREGREGRGGRGGGRGGFGGGPGGPGNMPEEMRKKMEDIRKQISDAEKAGDKEKADKLRGEARDMMHKAFEKMREQGGGGPGGEGRRRGPRPEGGPDAAGRSGGPQLGRMGGREGKIRQIRYAAQMLENAGFPEEAKKVRELASKVPQDQPAEGDYKGDGRPSRAGGADGSRDETRQRVEKLNEQVRRLSEQIEKLQREKK